MLDILRLHRTFIASLLLPRVLLAALAGTLAIRRR
jgi:hypothetical protein